MTAHSTRDWPSWRPRYVPDLNRLLDQCEHNYFTLMVLLERVKSHTLSTDALSLRVLERDRYTTTLQLDEMRTASQFVPPGPQFIVRLYHDVKLAEVLEWHNRRILKGSYPYPNHAMLQRDEKERVNQFLAEWLVSCEQRRLPVHGKDSDRMNSTEWKSTS